MNKLYRVFALAWFFSALFASSAWPLQAAADFEGGRRHKAGKINVLELHGSYHQMGRQYGYLLKETLQGLYREAVIDHFQGKKGHAPELLKATAMSLFRLYPQRFRDIITGMAETSGLTLEQHILLNGLELYGALPGGSAIAAYGEYTGGGPLVVGRNYDWYDSYAAFARTLTVTVFNPDGGIPTGIVTFAGVIYATTGMNARGLFLELNNGLPSGGGLAYTNRVPAIVQLLAFLNDFGSMEQLDAAFNTTRSNFSFIINAADRKSAWSYEWPPFDMHKRTGEGQGLLVSTNHFVDPAWGLVLQGNTGFKSVLRRENLLTLGGKHKGHIDRQTMMAILDTPMEKGGATWPRGGGIRTVYQVIAVPEQLQMLVKVPGYQNWTTVNLATLFAPPDSLLAGLLWNTQGGGDLRFRVERDGKGYRIQVERYDFRGTDAILQLTAENANVFSVVDHLFAAPAEIDNMTAAPEGATGTWTTVTLRFADESEKVLTDIDALGRLNALYRFVEQETKEKLRQD